MTSLIVGAGLAGLIAAHIFPRAKLIERMPRPEALHRALLRFRSTDVAQVTGIDFRPVTVRKGIWARGGFVAPTIDVANVYSFKVTGQFMDRSIWNIEPATRFIAPDDLYERLVLSVEHRIEWGVDATEALPPLLMERETIVSTAPMPELAALLKAIEFSLAGDPPPALAGVVCERAPIGVFRFKVPSASVYQTVYYPELDNPFYRISITGDIGIAEHAIRDEPQLASLPLWLSKSLEAFGINSDYIQPVGNFEQKYGKISPIHDGIRKEFIHQLSNRLNIYSLGRFATWRNILLDDVVADARAIKSMIEQGSAYANSLHFTRAIQR